MSNSTSHLALREQVATTSHALAEEGMVAGTAGNVSAREGDVVAITPAGAKMKTLTADAVCLVALDGTVLDGPFKPTTELELHLGVYRARADVGGVVHTHSMMASALSTVLTEVPVIHYQQLLLGGTLRVAPFNPFGSQQLADDVRDALADRQAALMANHGTVTIGTDLSGALDNAIMLEWLCKVSWHALAIGQPRVLDEAQQMAVIEAAIANSYGSVQSR